MLFDLYWSSPYAFKTLMNYLRLALSQIGSFDILKNFACIVVRMNYVCRFVALLCEFDAFSFWRDWDVHKIGGKLKRFHQLMCRI